MGLNRNISVAVAAVIGAAVAQPAAAVTVTFKNAQLSTSASVTAKVGTQTSSRNANKIATATKTVPVAPLLAAAFVTTTLPSTGAGIVSTANAMGTGTFLSAARGIFDFSSAASIVQTKASAKGTPVSGSANAGAYSLSYTFTVSDSANFFLRYALTDSNPALKYMSLISLKGDSPYLMALAPNTAGSLSTLLTAGQYRLQIANSGLENTIIRSGIGVGTTASSGLDHFAFTISGVPEASTWAMLIAGFGFVGAALRRRQAKVVLATA